RNACQSIVFADVLGSFGLPASTARVAAPHDPRQLMHRRSTLTPAQTNDRTQPAWMLSSQRFSYALWQRGPARNDRLSIAELQLASSDRMSVAWTKHQSCRITRVPFVAALPTMTIVPPFDVDLSRPVSE